MADQDQSPDHACDTEVKAKELEPEEDGKPADVHVAPGDTMLMDSQSVYINIAPPIIVQNGLRLKSRDRSLPFACYNYGTTSAAEAVSFIDWTVIVPQNDPIQGDHIRCHQVEGGEDLDAILHEYIETGAFAIVLINSADDYYLPGLCLHDVPLLVLKPVDGASLLEILKDEDYTIHAQVENEDAEHVEVEPRQQKSPASIQQPVLKQRLRKKSEFNGILQFALYQDRNPVCVSDNPGLFKQLISYFNQYEQMGREESVNSRLLGILATHRNAIMANDVPFYLLVVYRMSTVTTKVSRHYFCKQLEEFIYSTAEKLEELDQSKAAEALKSFLKRKELNCKLCTSDEKSLFEQLENSCLHLMNISSERKSEARPGGKQRFFYQKYIYCRMFWISLAMKCHEGYHNLPSDYWNNYLLKDCAAIDLDSDNISEIAKGLQLGNLLELQFGWTFTPTLMVKFLTYEKPKRFSQLREFVEAVQPHILLDTDSGSKVMVIFLRELHFEYSQWIVSGLRGHKKKGRIEALCEPLRSEVEMLDDGLAFLDSCLKVWKLREWDTYPDQTDEVCKRWLSFLLRLVDFEAPTVSESLRKFTKCKAVEVAQRMKKIIPQLIVAETRKHIGRLSVDQCFLLYRDLRVWKKKDARDLLFWSVKPRMRIAKKPWPKFLYEVVERHQGADQHDFLVGILEAVSHCYSDEKCLEQYVLDLLQLDVPKLFTKRGPVKRRPEASILLRSPDDVRREFVANLSDLIYDNKLRGGLLRNLSAILQSLSDKSGRPNEFQELVLSLVQEVVVPDLQHLELKAKELHCLALKEFVSTLSSDTQWMQSKPLSPRQSFCWHIVSACCEQLLVELFRHDITKYSAAIVQLCKIYESYCIKCLVTDEQRKVDSNALPEVTGSSLFIEKYFLWIYQIQVLLLTWKEKFDNENVTYDELQFFKEHCEAFYTIVKSTCVPLAAIERKAVTQYLDSFAHFYDALNVQLVKYLQGHPTAMCSLKRLLCDHEVKLPAHILGPLTQFIVLPYEEPDDPHFQAVEQQIQQPERARFQPAMNVYVKLSKGLTYSTLSRLVKDIDAFLEPVTPYLDMMVYFTLHQSVMFQTYLNHYLIQTSDSAIPTTHTSPALELDSLGITVLPMLHSPNGTAMEPIEALKRSLQHTQDLIFQVVTGTATYKDLTANGKLELSSDTLDIQREFKILGEFLPQLQVKFPECPATDDAGLSQVKSVVELFKFAHHISCVHEVFVRYNMKGCSLDPNFSVLLQIKGELEDESKRAKLTLLDATDKLCKVKSILGLKTEQQYKCLDFFTAILNCGAFYDFLEEKQFTGDKGKEKFANEYQLVTTQLQHEEYDEAVLNDLGGAFTFIQPFTQKDSALNELMTEILKFDSATAVRQLHTVISNITLIQIWFLRAEGETMVNVAHQLMCIIRTGNYHFNLSQRTSNDGAVIELVYLHLSESDESGSSVLGRSASASPPLTGQSPLPTVKEAKPQGKYERLRREQIDDFVRKLGFLDESDRTKRKEIQIFLHQNEIAYKLLDCFLKLGELGHPNYSFAHKESITTTSSSSLGGNSQAEVILPESLTDSPAVKFLPCYPRKEEAPQTQCLDNAEKELRTWRGKLADWHSQYDWLLFLGVPKVLKLHNLLTEKQPAVCKIAREISFLFQNDSEGRSQVQTAVEELLQLISEQDLIGTESGAMHSVGRFLQALKERLKQYSLPSSPPYSTLIPHGSMVLYYGRNYTYGKVTQKIVDIFKGLPHSFQVFHCHRETTEEELHLFMKRVSKHPQHYVLVQVNKLPFKLQEMFLRNTYSPNESTCAGQCSTIHFIESAPSILQDLPWVVSKKEEESESSADFTAIQSLCRKRVEQAKTFSHVKLVYGHLGDGKTHYIKNKLKESSRSVTISVNEAFSVANAIKKLQQSLTSDEKNCNIFFNFTLLQLEKHVPEGEKENYSEFLEAIGWFFFDLLLLGYVEDRTSGASFHLPAGLAWSIYAEVPNNHFLTPDKALEHFMMDIPALGLLGEPLYISPSTPFDITPDVQLVCKYLKAYDDIVDRHGSRRIDKLYPMDPDPSLISNIWRAHLVAHPNTTVNEPPIKFSTDPQLSDDACNQILAQHMDKNITKNKLMQSLFVRAKPIESVSTSIPRYVRVLSQHRYMHRRCAFLDTLPGFNYNNGVGEYTDTNGQCKKTDTRNLGSTMMKAMLGEVKEFCDPSVKQNWALKPHQQLIYDYKDGCGSFGLISLHPDQLPPEDKANFERIGVHIPTMREIHSRNFLDSCLSRALNVPLIDGHLQSIDDAAYVLTLDYTIKMLNIHERYECGVPVILEGETGVGKTALLEKLRDLWDESLLSTWRRAQDRILHEMRIQVGVLVDLPGHAITDCFKCVDVVEKLQAGDQVDERELSYLVLTPDCVTPHPGHCFHSVLREKLLLLMNDPVLCLVEEKDKMLELFHQLEEADTAQSVSRLLQSVFTVKTKHFFHKISVHCGLKPADVQDSFASIIKQARDLQHLQEQSTLKIPSVTVFLDEVNTSLCAGLFKEIIVDQTLDGEQIPDNIFVVAACNPHRGDSLAMHTKSTDTWLGHIYQVRQLHPTLDFLKWDYGSLDESQELAYVSAKLQMMEHRMRSTEVSSLTNLIVESQKQMRAYAFKQLKLCGIANEEIEKCSQCCVSQRDIQRVFVFYAKLKTIYDLFKPFENKQDYNRRAMVVALGIVYYMRLSTMFREEYEYFLNNQALLGEQVSFKEAFKGDLNWFMDRISLPTGIAKTEALKENLFAIIMCTMTHTPLIITGAPGSSKTLSFNLTVANLRGQASKHETFRYTELFPSLEPHYYQCSRRTTASELDKVFKQALTRQKSRIKARLPVYCVVFMDEAGLPFEKHEALKVLHSELDKAELSFVAITNHILDAAKTNRAVSLYRPDKSTEDLENLAKGCLCSEPDNPPQQLKDDVVRIVNFCPAYKELMEDAHFRKFFGLRDFIHFVNFLRRRIEHGDMLTDNLVLQALERNFNGSDNPHHVWNTFLSKVNRNVTSLRPSSVLKVLQESLKDCPQVMNVENEVRYKLIIDPSEDDSLVRLLFDCGVLVRENTQLFMCSDFPADGQLQKINTIAAIRHSAVQGHTVLLSQTDDIHESFYALFNQRFRRIEHLDGTRYFTNIAIGPIIKPSRVHKDFQCVVVVKKSEVGSTPAPFLNRFEKYCISHQTLLDATMECLCPPLKTLVQNAMEMAKTFVDLMEGPSSLYGIQEETLQSLVLTLLPFKHKLTHQRTQPSPLYEDTRLHLLKTLLKSLRCDAKFCIPQFSEKELLLDAASIFPLMQGDSEMSNRFKDMNHDNIDFAVSEALTSLHDENCLPDCSIAVSIEASIVICVLQQWLIRYLCKTLMQLMTPEALIHHRKKIPSSYLMNYLRHQNHFSLHDLITRSCGMLDKESKESKMSVTPTKLLCFTRSSALINKLPVTHPTSAITQKKLSEASSRELLERLVHSNADELIVCKLSSLPSQSSVEELLKEFVAPDLKQSHAGEKSSKTTDKRVLVVTVSMQEASKQMINHLRIMIEEAEKQACASNRKRLFVVVLHFPPSMFLNACYPSLFLRGWNHFYLDAVGYNPNDVILNVKDWLQLSCFGKDSVDYSTNDTINSALKTILEKPEAVAVVSSWTPFLTRKDGSFNKHMAPKERTQALRDLFQRKKVGEVLCDLFQSYWEPVVMVDHLERSALFTYKRESTLNITDSLVADFKSKFFDFLVFIVAKINEDFNIDIIYDEGTPVDITGLFLDILKLSPLPELLQLKTLCARLNEQKVQAIPKTPHGISFPFFQLIADRMDDIVEQSKEEVYKGMDVLSEDDQAGRHNGSAIYMKLCQVVEGKISILFQSEERECLSPAIRAMANEKVWQRYFSDFIHQKLHIDSQPDLQLSTGVLKAYFDKGMSLSAFPTLTRFVRLHVAGNLYDVNFAKLSSVLRTLDNITETATSTEIPQSSAFSPTTTMAHAESLVISVMKTGDVIGTPEDFSSYIIHALFNAMLGGVPGVVDGDSSGSMDSLNQWYKAYHDVITMQLFRIYALNEKLSPLVCAKFTVLQTLYLIFQTSNIKCHFFEACKVVQSLLNSYFTDDVQLKGDAPNLNTVAAAIFQYLDALGVEERQEQGRHIIEGLLSYFFPENTTQPYSSVDCEWFLNFANKHQSWAKYMQYSSKPSYLDDEITGDGQHTSYIAMHVFKSYLFRILRPSENNGKSKDGSPLGLYRTLAREQVGEALVSMTSQGMPGPYIPLFYKQISPFAQAENVLMQQPLAHLYFVCLLEDLLNRMYSQSGSLSYLLLAADRIKESLENGNLTNGSRVVLYIEKQAVLQALLRSVAEYLDPQDSKTLNRLFSSIPNAVETLNSIIGDPLTLGELEEGAHGLVLSLLVLRKFQSLLKLQQLLVDKHDVIGESITCLHPVHAKFKENKMGMLKVLHLSILGERDSKRSKLYDQIYAEMWAVQRSGGQNSVAFVQTARNYCGEGRDVHIPLARNHYMMILWMCTYFGFFNRNTPSAAMARVIEEQLGDVFELEYIHLIRFFLLAEPEKETPAATQSSKQNDPLFMLFCQPKLGPAEQERKHLCQAIAVMVAAVLGSPARSSPLWYYIFAADELMKSYAMDYDCMGYSRPGDETREAGMLINTNYWKNALRRGVSLHSHLLMLWANLSSISISLLTQPGAEAKLAKIIPPEMFPVRDYCVHHLQAVWEDFCKVSRVSKEECTFLAMSSMKRLLEVSNQQPLPSPLKGNFSSELEFCAYRNFWYQLVFLPSWRNMRTEFQDYTKLSSNAFILELMTLDACYPVCPSEQMVLEDTLSQKAPLDPSENKHYLLAEFVLNRTKLEVAGTILPKLIEFYLWLHSQLAYQLTHDQVETLAIKKVVEVVAKHNPKRTEEYYLNLYKQVKDGYNMYAKLNGGSISLTYSNGQQHSSELPLSLDEGTKVSVLISRSIEEPGALHKVISHIIECHNHHMEVFHDVACSEERSGLWCYLPNGKIPRINPKEVTCNTAIGLTKEFSHKQQAPYVNFQQLLVSRCQLPGARHDCDLTEVASWSILGPHSRPMVDLDELQADVIQKFFLGKPMIECLPIQQLRFRDTDVLVSPVKASLKVSCLDLTAISQKLPPEFKLELSMSLSKNLEIDFHSAKFYVLQEVVNGLRILAGHLIKVQLDEQKEFLQGTSPLHSQSLQQFLTTLYGSEASVEKVGIQHGNLSKNQLSSLKALKLVFLYGTLKVFVSWIASGYYDFCELPYSMKVELPKATKLKLEMIPSDRFDLHALVAELKTLCDALMQNEVSLTKKMTDGGIGHVNVTEKSLLETVKLPPECTELVSQIPKSVLFKHYVSFQQMLRRLKQDVQGRIKPDPGEQSSQPKQWSENVLPALAQKLALRKSSSLGRKPAKNDYGFPAGDKEARTLQSDLAKLAHPLLLATPSEDYFLDAEESTNDNGDHISLESETGAASSVSTEVYITTEGDELRELAETFDTAEIVDFLRDISIPEDCIEIFEVNYVTGSDLLDVTPEGLQALGVTSELNQLKISILFKRKLLGKSPEHSPERVAEFLRKYPMFRGYEKKFTENDIDGELLLKASAQVLEELGVSNPFHKTQLRSKFKKEFRIGKGQVGSNF